MKQGLVSIVIPTYNRARLVTRAIESALAQDYAPVEIIVVDDGSTDDTQQALAGYVGREGFRVVRHEKNRGVAAAKNTGLDHVQGEFATILDSDDELFPDAVRRLMEAFETLGENVGMVFANCVDPATGEWTGKGLHEPGFVTYADAVTGRFQGEFWGIWRTEVLGPRRFDERFPGGEFIVWHDLYRSSRVYYLHEALRKYHRGTPDSVSQVRFDREHMERVALMYEAYLQEYGDDMRRLAPEAYAKHLQAIALWETLAGRRLRGWKSLWRSIVHGRNLKRSLVAAAMALTPAPLLRYALVKRRGQ